MEEGDDDEDDSEDGMGEEDEDEVCYKRGLVMTDEFVCVRLYC